MVIIDYPSTNSEYYFVLQGAVVTNIRPLGNVSSPVTYNSSLDTMRQGREARTEFIQGTEKLHGENSVDHQKVSVEAVVSLIQLDSHPTGGDNPFAVTYPSGSSTMVSTYGFYSDGVSHVLRAGLPGALAWGFRTVGNCYHLYTLQHDTRYGRLVWNDYWAIHEQFSSSQGLFTRGYSDTIIAGTPADVVDMSVDHLAKFPALHKKVPQPWSLWKGKEAYRVYNRSSTTPLPTMRHVIATVSSVALELSNTKCPIEDYDYGTLALEATESSRINTVNMLAFIADMRNPKSLVPKLENLGKLPRDATTIKRLAGASDDYLTYHYGILPTVDDVNSIINASRKASQYYDRNGYVVYNAGKTTSSVLKPTWEVEQHIKLATSAEEEVFGSILRGFDNLGVFPSYENIWDLIPFSFVVDWFVNVGNFLQDYDNLQRLDRLNVKYVTMSKKTTVTRTLDSLVPGLNGSISLVRYHRWVTRQCPVPKLTLTTTSSDSNHWLESGALILQRIKH